MVPATGSLRSTVAVSWHRRKQNDCAFVAQSAIRVNAFAQPDPFPDTGSETSGV
jgi:hypothetical protein